MLDIIQTSPLPKPRKEFPKPTMAGDSKVLLIFLYFFNYKFHLTILRTLYLLEITVYVQITVL